MKLPQRVFLVGPNASGKSNLLDAFRFLRDIVSVGGGLQEAVRRRGGVSSLRCLAARQHSHISLEVQVRDDGGQSTWEYTLTFNQDDKKRSVIKHESVVMGGRQVLVRPDDHDRKDVERLTQTHLEQVLANQDFRRLADFFASIQYLHVVPQLIREPERSFGRTNDPFGGDLLERIARSGPRKRDARLKRIRKALQVAVPQLGELTLHQDPRGIWHLRGRYQHWRPQGAWQTEEHFSDGTLRLLGLLWALQEPAGPLLLEEPELSLHAEVVRYIPQVFARVLGRSGRQVLVSTHSVDVLRDEGVGLDEVLLLLPHKNGTVVNPAGSFLEIRRLLEAGHSLADAVMPRTRPQGVEQLSFAFSE